MFNIIFRRRIRRTRRVIRRRRRRSTDTRDYRARKEEARRLVVARLEHFSAEYARLDPAYVQALRYNRIAIRNTRSRWGSCSSKKNLNFNYKILDLSPELRDYVIAHELCHLKELHHGKAFWDLMKLTVPRAMEFHTIAKKTAL